MTFMGRGLYQGTESGFDALDARRCPWHPGPMADALLSREILDKTSTDTVERDVGLLSWTLANGVLEEYGSPFWHLGKAKVLIDIFTREEVSPWIGLAVMKRESSFGNVANNHDLDDRNLANPFGVHFNQDKRFDQVKRNYLLVPDPSGSYTSDLKPAASVEGFRLSTFEESASAAAATIHKRTLSRYNVRGPAYKLEIDDHLRQLLRRTYNNHRLREELDRVFAARR
jgi:hypothetical protein